MRRTTSLLAEGGSRSQQFAVDFDGLLQSPVLQIKVVQWAVEFGTRTRNGFETTRMQQPLLWCIKRLRHLYHSI
eukprot:scaffold9738_cov38-Cyclotella_meneghiniana.AAC.4